MAMKEITSSPNARFHCIPRRSVINARRKVTHGMGPNSLSSEGPRRRSINSANNSDKTGGRLAILISRPEVRAMLIIQRRRKGPGRGRHAETCWLIPNHRHQVRKQSIIFQLLAGWLAGGRLFDLPAAPPQQSRAHLTFSVRNSVARMRNLAPHPGNRIH